MLAELGSPLVRTTTDRGFNAEELADIALPKFISVADSAAPEVKAQARAFQSHIRALLVHYLKQAAVSERTTVCAALERAGHADLAKHIRSL